MAPQSEESEQDLIKSKSQKKREADALQRLGERLLDLSLSQLKQLSLPDELFDAVSLAKNIKARGGLKRQLQLIGKIMREVDPQPIEDYFQQLDHGRQAEAQRFKNLENMRDRLLEQGLDGLDDLIKQFPDLDIQHARQLVRNATQSKNEKLKLKAKREIFQFLKTLPIEF